jgi:hypothetical protein
MHIRWETAWVMMTANADVRLGKCFIINIIARNLEKRTVWKSGSVAAAFMMLVMNIDIP